MSESNWAGKSVPQMWASAQAADTQTAWQQVNAWRRTHDLLSHHAGRLKAAADELSYAWPPGRSPAAQAFIDYINQLRTAILAASADAANNYTALAGVLTSLSAAKSDMAKLKQQWDSHESQRGGAKTQSASSAEVLRETLNAEARSRMAKNDQEVLESSRRFVELTKPSEDRVGDPTPWDPGVGSRGGSASATSFGAGNGHPRSWMTAPSINPVDAIATDIGLAGSLVDLRHGRLADTQAPGITPGLLPKSDSAISAHGLGTGGGISATRAPSLEDSTRQGRPSKAAYPGVVGGAVSGTARPTLPGGQGRANPVGGVIEGSRPAQHASMLPFMGGARGIGEGGRDVPAALTMRWEVPEGVSPVIEPPPERPFVLGPGVIGIDR